MACKSTFASGEAFLGCGVSLALLGKACEWLRALLVAGLVRAALLVAGLDLLHHAVVVATLATVMAVVAVHYLCSLLLAVLEGTSGFPSIVPCGMVSAEAAEAAVLVVVVVLKLMVGALRVHAVVLMPVVAPVVAMAVALLLMHAWLLCPHEGSHDRFGHILPCTLR